jgi:pimeloyl-ACP methyl ester carboxylesterase
MIELIKVGWGQQNPAFRQIFTSLLLPEGTPEQMDWFNELQRLTTTPENAARIRTVQNDINVDDLAHQVRAPTLVIHVRDDSVVPFEEGRRIAARIPGARLLALEGHNHLMLANEPSWPRFRDEMRAFLREHDD